MPKTRGIVKVIDILIRHNNRRNGTNIETKEHATNRRDAGKEIGVVDLGKRDTEIEALHLRDYTVSRWNGIAVHKGMGNGIIKRNPRSNMLGGWVLIAIHRCR